MADPGGISLAEKFGKGYAPRNVSGLQYGDRDGRDYET